MDCSIPFDLPKECCIIEKIYDNIEIKDKKINPYFNQLFDENSIYANILNDNAFIEIPLNENNLDFSLKLKNDNKIKKKRNTHTKYCLDNIFVKINVHFMNFIVNLINMILKKLEIKIDYFWKINGKIKKNIKKHNIENIKNYTIMEIMQFENNLKCKEKNHNKDLINKIRNIKNNTLQKILKMQYIDIFKNYYYINKRDIIIDGLKIRLPMIFEDFLSFIKAKEDIYYKNMIKKVIKKYFLVDNNKNNNMIINNINDISIINKIDNKNHYVKKLFVINKSL